MWIFVFYILLQLLDIDIINVVKHLHLIKTGYAVVSVERNFYELTHLGQDDMDTILQTTFSNTFFFNGNELISIKILLKFIPKGPINSIPALV